MKTFKISDNYDLEFSALVQAETPREAVSKLLKMLHTGRGIVWDEPQAEPNVTIVTTQNAWPLRVEQLN